MSDKYDCISLCVALILIALLLFSMVQCTMEHNEQEHQRNIKEIEKYDSKSDYLCFKNNLTETQIIFCKDYFDKK